MLNATYRYSLINNDVCYLCQLESVEAIGKIPGEILLKVSVKCPSFFRRAVFSSVVQ